MSKLIVEVERDAHDDKYYKICDEQTILIERINTRSDLMLYLENKIKSME